MIARPANLMGTLPGMFDAVQIHTVLPGTVVVSEKGERGTVTDDQVVSSGGTIYATARIADEIERVAFRMTGAA